MTHHQKGLVFRFKTIRVLPISRQKSSAKSSATKGNPASTNNTESTKATTYWLGT